MAQPPHHGETPLIDEIFPNRDAPRQRTFEPTGTDLDQMAGMGYTERRAFRHRRVSLARRLLNRGKPVETLHPVRKVKPGKGVTTVKGSGGRRKVLLGIAGSAVGLPLGAVLMWSLMQVRLKFPGGTDPIPLPIDWNWRQFAIAAAFAIIAAVFAGLLPARKGARVQPVDILRGAQ